MLMAKSSATQQINNLAGLFFCCLLLYEEQNGLVLTDLKENLILLDESSTDQRQTEPKRRLGPVFWVQQRRIDLLPRRSLNLQARTEKSKGKNERTKEKLCVEIIDLFLSMLGVSLYRPLTLRIYRAIWTLIL